jgi:hypothetical protein
MKFLAYSALAVALLVAPSQAATSLRHHHHYGHELISTLPDERPHTPTEAEIASLESARANAAKVKKNPQNSLLSSIKADLE